MFQYDFMQRAFQASFLIALFAPIIGVFLILRRQSLMADALSHVSLVGVAIGFLLGLQPIMTTWIVVLVASLILEYLRKIYSNYSELSIAVLMTGGMSLALLLMNISGNGKEIENYLFGSIITISNEQIIGIAALAVLIIVIYIAFRRPLYVLTFDEQTAQTAGLPVQLMSTGFSIITGLAISIIMPIVGSLLVAAIMILPAAIAMAQAKSFNRVILLSVIVGEIGMFIGLTSSYHFDTPPGATITLTFIILFILSVIINFVRKKMAAK